MHYEVEIRESDYADDNDGGVRHLGWKWQAVTRVNDRGRELPIRFVHLDDARRLIGSWHPDEVRIIRVNDSGVRELMADSDTDRLR